MRSALSWVLLAASAIDTARGEVVIGRRGGDRTPSRRRRGVPNLALRTDRIREEALHGELDYARWCGKAKDQWIRKSARA